MTNQEYLQSVAKWQKHYNTTYMPLQAAEPETITDRDVMLAFAERDTYHPFKVSASVSYQGRKSDAGAVR